MESDVSIDEIAQSLYGCPADELNADDFHTCQVELEIFLKERGTETQLSRL